jgi:hypothetical protein
MQRRINETIYTYNLSVNYSISISCSSNKHKRDIASPEVVKGNSRRYIMAMVVAPALQIKKFTLGFGYI